MNFSEYLITLMLLSVYIVNSYPINMICVPACNPNITATAEFIKEWSNHSNIVGIHQLCDEADTVVSDLLKDVSTDVS